MTCTSLEQHWGRCERVRGKRRTTPKSDRAALAGSRLEATAGLERATVEIQKESLWGDGGGRGGGGWVSSMNAKIIIQDIQTFGEAGSPFTERGALFQYIGHFKTTLKKQSPPN